MASADYTVLTPERVALEYGVAGIGSRAGAAVIDTALQVIILGVVAAGVLGAAASLDSIGATLSPGVFIAVLVAGLFAISTGYFMIFEIVWAGQTPGKRLLGVRVIRESGYPLRPVDAVIRDLVRIADWLPALYGIGVLVMLFNPRSRRLGDFAAGTIVVREGLRHPLPSVDVRASAKSPVLTMAPADATLVRDFLVRREGMDPAARADLALRIARALSQRYHLPPPDSDPERFLERLA